MRVKGIHRFVSAAYALGEGAYAALTKLGFSIANRLVQVKLSPLKKREAVSELQASERSSIICFTTMKDRG
ncbi:hypothetical protein ALQ25_200238 [Pseudomonas coronafaciens pv. atropurpurea]|nr:hypothetical protein ALQ25_200238 [Pseudomonas coronafaciens pv. atropurpurea]